LLQRIRQSEARIRSLEESMDIKAPAAGPLAKPGELHWDGDVDSADDGEEDFNVDAETPGEGARYQLTMDESGNVSGP
jgi:hypothetical protein